jgi:hypothetical protein
MTNATTPNIPADHDCAEHLDIKIYDWDIPEGLLFFRITCPVCGFTGRMTVDTFATEAPEGAIFYTGNPDR